MKDSIWDRLNLQLFAEGGDGGASAAAGDGAGQAAAPTVVSSADDGREARLRALGVPEDKLKKRAKKADSAQQLPAGAVSTQQPKPEQQAAAPAQQAAAAEDQTNTQTTQGVKAAEQTSRLTWEEIMADPEYNKQMQATVQQRLKSAKGAEETVQKLSPVMDLLARKYRLDPKAPDMDALAKAIADDDSLYEQKAIELGVPIATAKKVEQAEREAAKRQQAEQQTIEQQRLQAHFAKLDQQGQAMKATFPSFDLRTELKNPTFARMTAPNSGISVEDAYYAVHRKEIQTAAMKVTAQKTAEQFAASIRSGQNRPTENGSASQAPSVTHFDYAKASREQREALKRQIRTAAARGEKIYPG